MLLAHQIRLRPNKKQITYFNKACGVARFTYNYLLAKYNEEYQQKLANPDYKPKNPFELEKEFNKIKREQFPFVMEVTKCAVQKSTKNLDVALKRFFKNVSRYPVFKKKSDKDSFCLNNDTFVIDKNRIKIPLLGWVRMEQELRFPGKIMSATIRRKADQWFVSVAMETNDISHLPEAENQGIIGIDLGIACFATLSNGEKFYAPKPLKRYLERLKRLDRQISKCQKIDGEYSKNRRKLLAKRAILYLRMQNIRNDFLNKLSTEITRRYHTIVMENLAVKNMMANKCMSRAISDLGWFEFKRQIQYKSEMRGGVCVLVDRFFPSSKKCSGCGHIKDKLRLAERVYTCDKCGLSICRDTNAAINLKNTVGSTVSACGMEHNSPSVDCALQCVSEQEENYFSEQLKSLVFQNTLENSIGYFDQ